ncbi:MAG: DUF742 domain-containing protein [Pseudonocardiaceae bacterium]
MSEGQHRPDHRHADGPVVGLTGARFGGATGRRLRQAAESGDERAAEDTTSRSDADRETVGRTGARFAHSRRGGRRSGPQHEQQVAQRPPGQPPPAPPAPESDPGWSLDEADWVVDEADWDGSEETYGLVRPYSWTGGRTTSGQDLAIEALISATERPLDPAASPEHHAVLRLCTTPRSVAEVAALLSVPLGVARVLLGDMAEEGCVMVHRTAGSAEGAPDLALMQRVLSCLQRL